MWGQAARRELGLVILCEVMSRENFKSESSLSDSWNVFNIILRQITKLSTYKIKLVGFCKDSIEYTHLEDDAREYSSDSKIFWSKKPFYCCQCEFELFGLFD